MMLSALRFDVDHLEGDFLARFDLGGLVYSALETAVLSALVRAVLVVMLRLGRPLPLAELHPSDLAILSLTTKSRRGGRPGSKHRRYGSASLGQSSSFFSPKESVRSLRRLLSGRQSISRTVRVAPLQVAPAPPTPIVTSLDGKAVKASSTPGKPKHSGGGSKKGKVDEAKPAESAVGGGAVIAENGYDQPSTHATTLAGPTRHVDQSTVEPAVCLPGPGATKTPTVHKLKAAEHYIVPKLSRLGAMTRLLGRLLLLPRSRRAAKRDRSARCRRILVVCAYTLGALYCLACAFFCWLFSIAFGSTIATEWLLTWALAVVIGAFVLQPLALCVQAVLRHYVAFKYANVFVNVVTG